MIKSMTGFGKTTVQLSEYLITVEAKSLNSRQLDLQLRLPAILREREAEIRSLINGRVERGKTDVFVTADFTGNALAACLNAPLIKSYYNELSQIAAELGEENSRVLESVMRMPDVINQSRDPLPEAEWETVLLAINGALTGLDDFRTQEGEILQQDFGLRIANIKELLDAVEPFEKARNEQLRTKLNSSFNEIRNSGNFDENRFEQELIYYFEKLDITEEKVRLAQHCDYFLATLADSAANGKKLGFIAQEIGREINTLGSKASDANIQKKVVEMKDELEKIKEQLANIL